MELDVVDYLVGAVMFGNEDSMLILTLALTPNQLNNSYIELQYEYIVK